MKILITDKQLVSLVEQLGSLKKLLQVAKETKPQASEIGSTIKKGFDLERKVDKVKKPKWDYNEVKISDNLVLVRNPKGGVIARVYREPFTEGGNYVDLKKTNDEFGEYYYMSAKMLNPIDAGRAFNELKKFIPSGARFGENVMGSLSTDSFYSMLRRAKSLNNVFKTRVKDYVKLNDSGVKRFQSFIKNNIKNDYSELRFKTIEDAQVLVNELNKEIKAAGITTPAKIKDSGKGYYLISIPNIQLIVP